MKPILLPAGNSKRIVTQVLRMISDDKQEFMSSCYFSCRFKQRIKIGLITVACSIPWLAFLKTAVTSSQFILKLELLMLLVLSTSVRDTQLRLRYSIYKFIYEKQSCWFLFYLCNKQATDGGGRSSQGFVDVVVVAGPNTQPPYFTKQSYDLPVSEGIPIGTIITTIRVNSHYNILQFLIVYWFSFLKRRKILKMRKYIIRSLAVINWTILLW